MKMKRKIKIGIIGGGRIGKLHAENIIQHISEAEVKTIAEVYVDHIKEWAKNLGIHNITPDYREILDDNEIDAVLICSSTDTHAGFVVEAAEAGKHIFCEKPVALSVEKLQAALYAVKKADVKLQVGFNRRFDRNHRGVRDAVAAGKIGEPHLIQISSRDPAPPPLEYVMVCGGLFLDMTIHDFDMARFLTDSEVVEVYAVGAVLVDPAIGECGDIDTAVVTLKFANGAIGIISNSREAAYGYDQRIEVFGSKGSVADFNETASTTVISTAEGIFSEKPLYFFLDRYRQSFVAELKEFVDAVLYDNETPVVGNDGLQAIIIALAAHKSFQENRPVKISEIECIS